mmetsp:Transcript_4245/g.15262  ORF Transcript_4245/g.15262 Transcript_4245/m.15262 type:complete len:115 (+) Transcript_4245:959-1303(+)
MVAGARDNLRYFGYSEESFTITRTDSCKPFRSAGGAQVDTVVAALPFGRNMRVPHEDYIGDMLANTRQCVPGARYCFVSGDSITKELEAAEYMLEAQVGIWNGRRYTAYVTLAS